MRTSIELDTYIQSSLNHFWNELAGFFAEPFHELFSWLRKNKS